MKKYRILEGEWNDGYKWRKWWKLQKRVLFWWKTLKWTSYQESVDWWMGADWDGSMQDGYSFTWDKA